MGRCLRDECQLPPGARLLLAVSGGPDSMALLHVLAGLRSRAGFTVEVCGVDHGLRAESAAELDLVQRYCHRLDVPMFRRRVLVDASRNLQARARNARYEALEALLAERQLDFLVTAHHQDDRAETVLLRLLRGAGPEGLAVLSPRLGNRLRPMVRAARERVLQHVERHRIPHVHDPSNVDARFARVRVRAELLPLMRQLSPGIVDHLTNLADEVLARPLPRLTYAGEEVLLNRGQRAQLRRALQLGHENTRIFLGHGREVTLDPRSGQPRIELKAAPPPTNASDLPAEDYQKPQK